MPTRITLSFAGDTQLDRTILRTSVRSLDLTPVWQALAERFKVIEGQQFDTEGAAGGARWPALSPAYAAWKRLHYGDRKILDRTGALRESLTGGAGFVQRIGPQTVYLGTSIPYAQYHQIGTPRMPMRKPVSLTDSERQRWVRAVTRWIVRGIASTE